MEFDVSASQQRAVAAVVVLVAAVVLGGVAAVALNVGPFGGGGPAGGGGDASSASPPPTGTVYTDISGGSGEEGPPFSFAIEDIEECGQTCRDVTATVSNEQNETAESVTVYTRIYAGNSTAEDDRVWRGEEDVGVIDANGDSTRTQRVELSTSEAFTIQQKGGWITILTTVESADTTITFKNRRQVA